MCLGLNQRQAMIRRFDVETDKLNNALLSICQTFDYISFIYQNFLKKSFDPNLQVL